MSGHSQCRTEMHEMQAGRPHVELTEARRAAGIARVPSITARRPGPTAVRSLMPMVPSSIDDWLSGAGFGDCA